MIPSAPVDADTASLLALISSDRIHADDARTVVEGIVETCRHNDGVMDPNMLRAWLRDEWGGCMVYPPIIGATVQALSRKGVLKPSGWVVTTGSTSGNNGRPARSYRLTKPPVDIPSASPRGSTVEGRGGGPPPRTAASSPPRRPRHGER